MMDATAYVALSRQTALQRGMDTIANNIANMNTAGFKAERMVFEEVLDLIQEPDDVAFVHDVAIVRDLSQGPLTPTGNPFDIALNGPGYFAVSTPEGERYTRSGSFSLNDAFELVNSSGHRVLDDGGSPIVLPDDGSQFSVAEDGTISAGEDLIARIGVVGFANEHLLEKTGDGLHRSNEGSEPITGTRIAQGMIEGSNVNAILEMTTMMATVRAFQSTQKLIETHHELERRAIEQMLAVDA